MRSSIKKALLALTAVATVAGATVATSSNADARYYRGGGWGFAGPAIVGGLALGALAASRPYYGYGYGYPAYGYGDGCLRRRVVGYTPYGRPIVRAVNVCY